MPRLGHVSQLPQTQSHKSGPMAKPAKRPLAKPCLGSTSPGSSEIKDLRATKASPFWLRRLRFLKTQIQGRFRKDQRNSWLQVEACVCHMRSGCNKRTLMPRPLGAVAISGSAWLRSYHDLPAAWQHNFELQVLLLTGKKHLRKPEHQTSQFALDRLQLTLLSAHAANVATVRCQRLMHPRLYHITGSTRTGAAPLRFNRTHPVAARGTTTPAALAAAVSSRFPSKAPTFHGSFAQTCSIFQESTGAADNTEYRTDPLCDLRWRWPGRGGFSCWAVKMPEANNTTTLQHCAGRLRGAKHRSISSRRGTSWKVFPTPAGAISQTHRHCIMLPAQLHWDRLDWQPNPQQVLGCKLAPSRLPGLAGGIQIDPAALQPEPSQRLRASWAEPRGRLPQLNTASLGLQLTL